MSPLLRPTAVAAAVLAVGGFAAGCGSDDEMDGLDRTAESVEQHFKAVTGDSLEIDYRIQDAEVLSAAEPIRRTGPRLSERYGTFSIAVAHDDDFRKVFTRRYSADEDVKPDANGIRWFGGPGGYSAIKEYDNVILRWTADSKATDMRFKRLDLVLSTLGKPAGPVRAKLPASDRSCLSQGMGIAGAKTGTCRDSDGRTLTTIDRGSALKLKDQAITLVRAGRTKQIKSPYRYMEPAKAKGTFVAVRMKVANTGTMPLRGFPTAQLRIGDNYYEQDYRSGYGLGDRDTYPLQPGEDGMASLVFDVPDAAAAKAQEGALVLSMGETASIDYASAVGALRLGSQVEEAVKAPPAGATRS